MAHLTRALAARCELLGLEGWALVPLALDLVLLGVAASQVARRLGAADWPRPRRLLACGLLVLSAVVGSATALGALGWLSNRNLLLAHGGLALAALAASVRRAAPGSRWREAVTAARQSLGDLLSPASELLSRRAWGRERRAESLLLAAIVVVLALYAVLATFTLPLNFDSNTYRLSRLAIWLQEGSTHHFATNDERQNWVGQNVELVMLWLVSFFRHGYPLVQLVQWAGGVLACLAIRDLGAQLGLGRRASLGAVLLLLGLPTAATQFFSSQADLFVGGCLTAGVAFLPAALRGGRAGEWALAGAGCGLALGGKATALYFVPGLILVLLAWAWLAHCPLRRLARGTAVAGLVCLPLCGFNFALNWIDYGHPLAPAKPRQHGILGDRDRSPWSTFATHGLAMVWQLFEPHSNPLLPRALHEPAFTALLEALAERDTGYRQLRDALPEQGGWRARGLNEDEASFGLLAALLAAAGGVGAAAGAAFRRARDDARIAALAAATASFFVLVALFQTMNVNLYRYFCVVAPAVALLGGAALARLSGSRGRAVAALLLLVQFAGAIDVARLARNQGLRVLRDPASARWYPNWRHQRELVATLGDRPLDLGLAVYANSWQAPALRAPVPHRWRLIELAGFGETATAGGLLAARGLDGLVVEPGILLGRDSSDVSYRAQSRPWLWRLAVLRPLGTGEAAVPKLLLVEGIDFDRWSERQASFWVADWRAGRFALRFDNPTPLARDVELRSGRETVRFRFAPQTKGDVAVAVSPRDEVVLAVAPEFEPGHAGDRRRLGLLLEPPAVAPLQGVYEDGWTAPTATFELVNWLSGSFAREVSNPTALRRTVRARGALGEWSWILAPGSAARIELPVLPLDRVELEVAPPFVPAASGASADARALGVILLPAAPP